MSADPAVRDRPPLLEDAAALNAAGRACLCRGDAAHAIAFQRHALRLAPEHAAARTDLRAAEGAIADAPAAAAHYRAALEREPDVATHHRPVGVIEPFVGIDVVAGDLRAAVAADPSHAPAWAALGNVAARRGDRAAAMGAYALAALLDWDDPAVHLALAQLYDTAGNERDGRRHLDEALARRTFYRAAARGASRRVLLLKTRGTFLANALHEFCLDPNRTDADVFYVTPETTALPEIAPATVVINAIGEREEHAATIARAIALCDALDRPVLNHPRALRHVAREALATRLAGISGVRAVAAARVERADLITVEGPSLVRPVDAHRGDDLERVDDASALGAYLARTPAAAFAVAPFVDYRSGDGFHRKYRVIVIDGVPYPYHLAISDEWLVHYWRVAATMRAQPWMTAEEERFLRAPEATFPAWNAAFGAIATALELDVFGVDCAVLADGTILVFECDPSAFVHCRTDVDGVFAYKYRYVPRIFAAFDELVGAASAAGENG